MNPIDYKEIRKRVDKRVKRRIEFIKQLVAYVPVNLAVWLLYFLLQKPGAMGFPWPIILTVLWGIGIVIEGANVYFDGAMDRMRERELEREYMRLGIYNHKPKRSVHLSDDGELIDDDDDEYAAEDDEQPSVHRQKSQK